MQAEIQRQGIRVPELDSVGVPVAQKKMPLPIRSLKTSTQETAFR